MSFGGQTTTALTWDDSAADIQAALEALSSIGAGNVTCAGGALPTDVTVTFAGTLAGQDAALITVDNTNMTGGTASVAETTTGRAVQGILGSTATASLLNGQIRITDAASGYSRRG